MAHRVSPPNIPSCRVDHDGFWDVWAWSCPLCPQRSPFCYNEDWEARTFGEAHMTKHAHGS